MAKQKKMVMDLYVKKSMIPEFYSKQVARFPPLSRAEELTTIIKAKKGNQKARDLVIVSNLRFVINVAMEYVNSGISIAELISIGNMGMIEAIHRFDPERGFKFISYAVWWIRQSILNALKASKIVTQPINRQEDMAYAAKAERLLAQQLGRKPTLAEVAAGVSMDERRLCRALSTAQEAYSLDEPILDYEDEVSPLEFIVDNNPLPDEVLYECELKDQIQSLIHILDDREQQVINLYFGFSNEYRLTEDRLTLEEIGKKFNVTRERIRQIRNRALNKMRRESKRKGLSYSM